MVDEELERQGIIAQLITLHKDNQKLKEIHTAILMQMVVMNTLTREILYISGGNPKVIDEKIEKEIKYSLENIEKFFEKIDKLTKFPILTEKVG